MSFLSLRIYNFYKLTFKDFALIRPKISASGTMLILVSAILVAIIYNTYFWQNVTGYIEHFTLASACFIFSLFLLITLSWMLMLSLFIGDRLLKITICIMLFFSSIFMYFNSIGVVFDEEMISNILESNLKEALELVSLDYIIHILLFWIIPSIVVFLIPVSPQTIKVKLFSRLAISFSCLVIITLLLSVNYKFASFYIREHRNIRLLTVPFYPIYSFINHFKSADSIDAPFIVLGKNAKQIDYPRKRKIGILVVGETARADHFSLNGYSRNTNPYLSTLNITSYKNVFSCGTSTAYSVPCMFSFLDEKNFSKQKSQNTSNVLDVLKTAGVKPVWIDNNSSCKGVCERNQYISVRDNVDSESPYLHDGLYYDEILTEKFQNVVNTSDSNKDLLIVLHPLGSHGPAYYRRYPEKFANFKPECKSNSPYTCKQSDVINSYDNSILYTDFFLYQVVQALKSYTENSETFLLYVSDHGESLGENGVYLHGLPPSFAPAEQKHVPLITWFSNDFSFAPGRNGNIKNPCTSQQYSHDNLSHTLLNIFDIESQVYKPSLDMLRSSCDDNNSL